MTVDMHQQMVVEPARRACTQILELAQRAQTTIARARQIAHSPDYDGQSRYLLDEALTRLGAAVDKAQSVLAAVDLPRGFQGEPLLRSAGGALQSIETYIAQAEQTRREFGALERRAQANAGPQPAAPPPAPLTVEERLARLEAAVFGGKS